jgi:hypothetical protein
MSRDTPHETILRVEDDFSAEPLSRHQLLAKVREVLDRR